MKTKPAFSRSSSTSLTHTHKSSVRSLPETKECFAVDLSLNSNGTQVAVLTVPTTIQLFDASTLKYVTSLSSTSNTFDINQSSGIKISSIQFTYVSPHTLFAATNKNLVLGWDIRTPQQEIFQLDGCVDEHKFLSVTCNNDDHLVAAGSELKGEENVGIGFWDLRASRQKELLGYYTESHSDDIIQVQFCRMNTNRLISGSTDGLVCLYDISKPNEEDALEQVYNANGPIAKCGFASHDSIYATTSFNTFFLWSTSDEGEQLLVQGDTLSDLTASEIPAEKQTTSSEPSAPVHHLASTHSTIVDVLTGSSVKDLFPSAQQKTKPSWALLMCDHVGKMNVTLISSDQSPPVVVPLASPHSETVRAAVAYQSSVYSCADDGRLIRWQAPSMDSANDNSKQTPARKYFNSKRPY